MKDTEERFLKCVGGHELTVIRDDDLYRHLRFKNPRSFSYWYDIVTWPGYLVITGDAGSYLFSRLPDMFEFFRRDPRDGKAIPINPDYWAEKLEAQECNGKHVYGVRRWSVEKFDACVRSYVADYMRNQMRVMDFEDIDPKEVTALRESRRGLIEAVRDEVMGRGDDGDAMRAVCDFSFEYETGEVTYVHGHPQYKKREFHFQDFWEHDCTEWDYTFLWCCYAIVWGIQRYDARRARPWYRIEVEECRKRSPVWRRQILSKAAI